MSLAKRLLNNPGLIALTVPEERREVAAVMGYEAKSIKLQYLMGSRQKGLRLWNVIAPQLPGYSMGPLLGYPTFSLAGLQERNLL